MIDMARLGSRKGLTQSEERREVQGKGYANTYAMSRNIWDSWIWLSKGALEGERLRDQEYHESLTKNREETAIAFPNQSNTAW